MKILFLTPWYPDDKMPHHGVFVRDQAVAVSRQHEVIAISAKVDYSAFKLFSWKVSESVFEGVKEYRLVVNRSIPFINQLNYLLLSVWLAYKITRRLQPDVIHGNIAYPGAIWSYCVSRLTRKPYVVSDHTSRFTDNFRSTFHRVVTMISMRRAAHVIAVSSWAAKKIADIVGRPVDIIPNLIHVDQYSVQPPGTMPVQIGFLGGLSSGIHRKGLDVLLKAIAGIDKEFILHIGGAGKLLGYYKELAQAEGVFDKCRFHGFVDYVPDFMHKLHFFVSSSRIEAFGMVIVEAMACGLPVVATNSGGPADFIDETCGVMVQTEDVQALRNAIAWMIDHHSTYDRNRIRMKAVENFSAEVFIDRIGALYQSLR